MRSLFVVRWEGGGAHLVDRGRYNVKLGGWSEQANRIIQPLWLSHRLDAHSFALVWVLLLAPKGRRSGLSSSTATCTARTSTRTTSGCRTSHRASNTAQYRAWRSSSSAPSQATMATSTTAGGASASAPSCSCRGFDGLVPAVRMHLFHAPQCVQRPVSRAVLVRRGKGKGT